MEFEGRQRHTVSEIASWLAVAAILFVFAKNFSDIRRTVAEAIVGHPLATTAVTPSAPVTRDDTSASRDGVELVADRSGHFAASLDVNGRDVEALVDTGATIVMLTYEDAQKAGLYLRDSDFTMQMQTANGLSRAAPVTLERVSIGPILVRNVQAGVAERGVLRTNLLGMSFLKRLQSFEIRSGRLVLKD
jgi:aspartyl protease family protein